MTTGFVVDDDGLEFAKWICETKKAHPTVADARIAANARFEKDLALKRLCIYKCPACGQHHLTSKKTRIVVTRPPIKEAT